MAQFALYAYRDDTGDADYRFICEVEDFDEADFQVQVLEASDEWPESFLPLMRDQLNSAESIYDGDCWEPL